MTSTALLLVSWLTNRELIKSLGLLLLGLMLLISSTPALAHAQLISSTPKANSKISVLPDQVKLIFDDDLIDLEGGNQIQVFNPKGKRIYVAETALLGNQLTVNLRRESVLGKYTVAYRVLSADGHPVSSRFYFTLVKKATKK